MDLHQKLRMNGIGLNSLKIYFMIYTSPSTSILKTLCVTLGITYIFEKQYETKLNFQAHSDQKEKK